MTLQSKLNRFLGLFFGLLVLASATSAYGRSYRFPYTLPSQPAPTPIEMEPQEFPTPIEMEPQEFPTPIEMEPETSPPYQMEPQEFPTPIEMEAQPLPQAEEGSATSPDSGEANEEVEVKDHAPIFAEEDAAIEEDSFFAATGGGCSLGNLGVGPDSVPWSVFGALISLAISSRLRKR